jgi:hypothetical protein
MGIGGYLPLHNHSGAKNAGMAYRHRRYRSRKTSSLGEKAIMGVFLVGAAIWAKPQVEAAMMSPEERAAIERSVYYPGCDQVRARGKAPIYRGQPGYRPAMDGDGDGVACEPYY